MNNVIKVSDHFWVIEEKGVRSFLFEGNERAMLVDTGFGTLPLRAMVAELTDLPVFVVNTHTDKDHIEECERLNGFPDGWTDTGMPERMRYFCMGNALVVPLVQRIGTSMLHVI